MTDQERFELKKEALAVAETYVEPICERRPLEKITNTSGTGVVFTVPSKYDYPPAEQEVDLLIKLADWLVN